MTSALGFVTLRVILRTEVVELGAGEAGAGVEGSERVRSSSDNEDSSDSESESESDSGTVADIGLVLVVLRLGGLREVLVGRRLRFVSPFMWAGSDFRRWVIDGSLRAATRAGKTAGGGEADTADLAGVECRLSTKRDLYRQHSP